MATTYKQSDNPYPFLRTLRQLFIPDWLQIACSLVVAIVIYGIVSARYYWNMLIGENTELKTYSSETFHDTFGQLSQLPGMSTVTVALIWGIVGIGMYILVLFVTNLFITTQNNKTVTNEFRNKPKSILVRVQLDQYRRLVWITLFAVVMWLSVVKLLPLWLGCFYIFNNFGHQPQFFVIALLGLAYNLYLLFACLVVVWRNPKVVA